MTRNSPPSFDDIQKVVMPDKQNARCRKYENESQYTGKLALPAGKNKVMIYERTALFKAVEKWRESGQFLWDLQKLRKSNSWLTMMIMACSNIDIRKRWNRLYDRSPLFSAIRQSFSAEISGKMIQLRYLLPAKEPAKHAVGHFRKNGGISRILIYRRNQMKLHHDDRCLPLIRNKPCSSEVIDELSGQTLSHITLLCRDVICKCNKCATGLVFPRVVILLCLRNKIFDEIIEGIVINSEWELC